jgi:hypothetical protein
VKSVINGASQNTEALSRQHEVLAKSRRAFPGREPPFDGRSHYATAAQGYGFCPFARLISPR